MLEKELQADVLTKRTAREGLMQLNACIESHDSSRDEWIRGTELVRRLQRIRKEILDHKWYESEKAGRDIGWDRAVVDWTIRFGHGL